MLDIAVPVGGARPVGVDKWTVTVTVSYRVVAALSLGALFILPSLLTPGNP